MSKLLPFVLLADHHPRKALDDPALRAQLAPPPRQGSLFDAPSAPTRAALVAAGGSAMVAGGLAQRCARSPAARRRAGAAGLARGQRRIAAGRASGHLGARTGRCWRTDGTARLPGTGGHLPVPSRRTTHGPSCRLLWRIAHGERSVLSNPADADVLRAMTMAQAVRRDTHKMKAFVRFREVPGQPDAFIAWFEPQHHIVDRVAPFFARCFTGMRWAILTPSRSVAWDGQALAFGPGARREDAPAEDARESLWQTYYASIFNPARLNTRMMMQEMPAKYWRHLPEAQCCHAWCAMRPTACRRCMTGRRSAATQDSPRANAAAPATDASRTPARTGQRLPPVPVVGAGHADRIRAGTGRGQGDAGRRTTRRHRGSARAAVRAGPAGQVLDRALAELGIDRAQLYLTNAVKHFHHERRGRCGCTSDRKAATSRPAGPG